MNGFVEIINNIINRKIESKDRREIITLKIWESEDCEEAIEREIRQGRTLEQIIFDWDKGCCNRDYFSGFKIFIIGLWDKITGDNTPIWKWLDD